MRLDGSLDAKSKDDQKNEEKRTLHRRDRHPRIPARRHARRPRLPQQHLLTHGLHRTISSALPSDQLDRTHRIDVETQQDNPNTNTMDMMMDPGAPGLTQPGVGHNRVASFDSTHSGSDSSDGGVALDLPTTPEPATNNSTRKTRLSKHARKALCSRKASASTNAGIEPPPVVAVTPTTTNKMKANSSAPKSRPSKMARKALRKRKAAASASTGDDHKPSPVFAVDTTTTEQATTNGSKRNARLSKKARKTFRRRKAAAAAAHTADAPPADSHRSDTNPAEVPADAPDGAGNDAVTEIAAIITET